MNQRALEKSVPYYSQLQQTIKERIWNGFYKPGDRLLEAQLAKEFEVSRSPVREAIRTLINEGLLTMGSNSQITVYEPSLQDVRDIYECRIALESIAVALTAEQATAGQVNELEKILQETRTAIETKEKENIVKCNVRFHELIIEISGNLRLKKIVEDLHSLTYYYRLLNTQGSQRADEILKGHSEIFKAIKEKNPKKAAEKLAAHTQEDLENLMQLFEQEKSY